MPFTTAYRSAEARTLAAITDALSPQRRAPAVITHSPTAAGAFSNPSPECARILADRLPLEKAVAGARERIRFYEAARQNDFTKRELAFNRSILEDAVNALAQFDLAYLTEECRERLTRFGMSFTSSTSALRQAAE